MSGVRFARTGRFRLFAGFFGLLIFLLIVIGFLHSSSMQCEQVIDTLRKRVQLSMEQNNQLERVKEKESNEHMEYKRNLEDKLKEERNQHKKDLLDARMNMEKLQQTHKLLQNDHTQLVKECAKSKKQQLDDANSLEKNIQSLRLELQKAKNLQENEIALWKEKYNVVLKEKLQLEAQNNKPDQEKRVKLLETIVAEFSSNCLYKPKTFLSGLMQQQINKPLNAPETTHNGAKSGLQMPSFDKPENDKNFKEQESVSPGLYHIPIKVGNDTEKTNKNNNNKTNITFKINEAKQNSLKAAVNSDFAGTDMGGGGAIGVNKKIQQILPLSFTAQNNRSLILNSVENFQIVPKPLKKLSDEETQETQLKQQPENLQSHGKVLPLSAPRKLTSKQSAKSVQGVLEQANNASSASTSSSTSLPPLPLPPNQRKQLPAMVAPIPEFDQLLKDEVVEKQQQEQQQQESPKKKKLERDAADIDAAIEQQNENDDQGTNNRYANVVNDMEARASQKKSAKALPIAGDHNNNEDSGTREVKDNEVLANEPNFNLPADEDDNNFFDAGEKNAAGDVINAQENNNHKDKNNDDDNDDDDLGLGGDIAVKNQNLLEADNLNNEVAGDQGKEAPDGLGIEDEHDEDEDEDEYAHLVARQQGAQAIRN